MSQHSTGLTGNSRPRTKRGRATTVALLGLLAVATSAGQVAASAAPRQAAPPTRHTDLYHFDSPDAAAVAGNDLFVANRAGDSVTELNATTGGFVRLIAGPAYGFEEPTAVHVVGSDLFVADGQAGVTELRVSNGSLVRTLRGKAYGFSDPVALASNGSSLLYVLSGGGAVTKIVTATGRSVAVARGRSFHFEGPTALALDHGNLFVTNRAGNSVTEISATTMRVTRILRGASYGFARPTGVATHGSGVWVTNFAGPSLTEISATTGRVVKVVPNWEGNLPSPGPITYGDGFFYAASPPGQSPMVTQIEPAADVPMPWMMCNTNGPYQFANPEALVVANSRDLWVVNEGSRGLPGNSLTEMRTTSGKWIRTIR